MKKIKRIFHKSALYLFLLLSSVSGFSQPSQQNSNGLHFNELPTKWEEAIPLGNGMLGALIYVKNNRLRIALDRADLWDLRPIKSYDSTMLTYKWISEQVHRRDYSPVKEYLKAKDITSIAPTKITAAALEFPIQFLGKVISVDLNIERAVCIIKWLNGAKATIYIDANHPLGCYQFDNLPIGAINQLIPGLEQPAYQATRFDSLGNPVIGPQDLAGLGYPKGSMWHGQRNIVYKQQGWSNFNYEVAVGWQTGNQRRVVGYWSVSTHGSAYSTLSTAEKMVNAALKGSWAKRMNDHMHFWADYWSQSDVIIPDPVLSHQYNMDMYLFAAASRKGSPPISLQAVWTADNGKLPPWHGDLHNDLNTQLSYWPGYAANHLAESSVFTDWLWSLKPEFEKYTEHIFANSGLNVPGVAVLNGKPRGQWAQYLFSPTVSCWLSQYFYWQWKYSGDSTFLKEKAYPWVKAALQNIESIAVKDSTGKWNLPISSSPEIFNDELKAWFQHCSNFDLSLIHWQLASAIEMAGFLHLKDDVAKWKTYLAGWPGLALDPADSSLLVAPGIPYNFSHRHFSHLMSIFPLQLLDWYNDSSDRKIILASLAALEREGPSGWMGYSYAWQACLFAMAEDGDAAAKALQIFSTAFCSPNSFHLNGDQSGKGYSGATSNPFTLEGNFAFARAVQLMLLQQHHGINYLFPAIPSSWPSASFNSLRTPGAFLVSAELRGGLVERLKIKSLKGGEFKIKNPYLHTMQRVTVDGKKISVNLFSSDVITIYFKKGEQIEFESKI